MPTARKARFASLAALASLATMIPMLSAAVARGQQTGDEVRIEQPATDDLYLAGGRVDVGAPVDGDVVAAGGDVRIGAPVEGDAMLAGRRVVVAGPVDDDVRAAGAEVVIAAPIGGHLVAAGQSVAIQGSPEIGGWAWLTGARVRVDGSVGSLRAIGETVTLSGEVRGDANVQANTIRLAPGAIVRGDLRWASPAELIVGEGARVEGAVVRGDWQGGGDTSAMMLGALALVLGLLVSVVLLVVIAPRGTRLVAARARMSVTRSLVIGLAVIVLTPVVAGFALLSGLLWIIGVILLAGYVLALMLGGLLGVVTVADLGLELRGHPVVQTSLAERAATTALAAVVVAGLAMIPVVGPIVVAVLTVIGVGALVLSTWRARRAAAARELTAEPSPA